MNDIIMLTNIWFMFPVIEYTIYLLNIQLRDVFNICLTPLNNNSNVDRKNNILKSRISPSVSSDTILTQHFNKLMCVCSAYVYVIRKLGFFARFFRRKTYFRFLFHVYNNNPYNSFIYCQKKSTNLNAQKLLLYSHPFLCVYLSLTREISNKMKLKENMRKEQKKNIK